MSYNLINLINLIEIELEASILVRQTGRGGPEYPLPHFHVDNGILTNPRDNKIKGIGPWICWHMGGGGSLIHSFVSKILANLFIIDNYVQYRYELIQAEGCIL